MLRSLLTIYFLLITFALQAQTLRGVVTDGATGNPLASVSVSNVATQQTAYTDANGGFTIIAAGGQQLVFMMLGYETTRQYAPPGIGNAAMQVSLRKLSFTLDEFIFKPKYTPYQLDSIERIETYQRALSRQRSSVMSPVSFIAERLSKNSKQIFRFQKSFNMMEDIRFIDSRYSPYLVAQLTGLKGDTIGFFMNAYPMPYEYARGATDLELKMWIRSNYKLWLQSPKIPDSITVVPLFVPEN